MKARYFIGILVVVVLMFFLSKKDRAAKTDLNTDGDSVAEVSDQVTSVKSKPSSSEAQSPSSSPESQNQQEDASSFNVPAEQLEEIQKNFSDQLRQMGQCLEIQMNVDQEKIDPKYESLVNNISPAFGNMLVKMDDWTQWDGQASDGTVKRIRTEIEYLENNIPTKRVQLYKLNEQGMPELQPLDEDIALNPPDEYLLNMRGDAKTILDQKATRGYYAEGEELVVIERNGKVQSFSMSKGEKTFNCQDTDTLSSDCQCL